MSLTGRLEDLGLADIFQILSIGKKTGSLTIENDQIRALVIFKNGLVIKAETDAIEDLGEDLQKAGLISDETLGLAREIKKKLPGKAIAEILLELGSVRRDHIERIVKKRIEKVVYTLLLIDEGDFRFEPEVLSPGAVELRDPGWEMTKGLLPEYLLMEGARVYDETQHQGDAGQEEGLSGEEFEESWAPEETVIAPKDISALIALTQELRFPDNYSEISLLILRFASDIFQRGVLFMVSKERLSGFGQFGLDVERADEKISETVLPLRESPFLQKIISDSRPFRGPLKKDRVTETLIREIGGEWPSEVALFPITAEGQVIALLYCDNQPANQPLADAPGLEIFINQAGLALEKAMLYRKLLERDGASGGEK